MEKINRTKPLGKLNTKQIDVVAKNLRTIDQNASIGVVYKERK